ncbi:MAG: VWA domain-containing protein, partial [Proteobacteria bacterium]|nr:VWA domain-containing protein [Pseudomonadota bacterium]
VIDVSQSEGFGSKSRLKSEVIAELGGMLSYAATHTGDRVGALFFAGEVEKIVPPKKGRQHVLRLIRDLLTFSPQSRGTHLIQALEATDRIMKHRGIVFILSDFLAEGYESALRKLARRHDVVWLPQMNSQQAGLCDKFAFGTRRAMHLCEMVENKHAP